MDSSTTAKNQENDPIASGDSEGLELEHVDLNSNSKPEKNKNVEHNHDETHPCVDDETEENSNNINKSDNNNNSNDEAILPNASTGCSRNWSRAIQRLHVPVKRALHTVVHSAATHPKLYIVGMISLALLLLVVGLFTNFNVDVDGEVTWTPFRSKPVSHKKWIEDDSGFPDTPGMVVLLVHKTGTNVLGKEGVRRVFLAVDTVRNTPGYESVCTKSENKNEDSGTFPCVIEGVTSFWNDTFSIFDKDIETNEQAIRAMSAESYPDGTRVDRASILGNIETNQNGTLLTSAQVYVAYMPLVDNDDGNKFEGDVLDLLFDLQDAWDAEAGNDFVLEVTATRSFEDEFNRGIINDIPLIPLVFVIMSVFTCLVFFRYDKVKSRSLLGFGAVVSVLLSIMSGYGLLFLIGVPFTSMTQILPFIMFGIGLDDAFIISVAYERTDRTKDPVARLHDTIEEVGVSITLTTLTSTLAFGLGCISTIPAVYWLCLYAFPTIIFDFIFQMTFFIALLVVDEKRIQDNRRDCLVCVTADAPMIRDEHNNNSGGENNQEETTNQEQQGQFQAPLSYRFMSWYAKQLLRPWMKAIVILVFTALFVVLAISTARLKQDFQATDVLPDDSYVADFFDASDDYSTEAGISPMVYFRLVNQSDPFIQSEMEAYVDALVALDEIENPPTRFWLWDLREYLNTTEEGSAVASEPFRVQLDAFLNNPVFKELYTDHIVLDSNGDIAASRTMVVMNLIDLDDVRDQVDALENQRDVTRKQPENKGKSDWPFFTYEGIYNIWEFYSVSVDELILTTIYGVVAVSGIGFVFIPHWSAVMFVFPMIVILYIDLLGFIQLCGLHVNVVSYIALVMSIGLLVDFIIHPLLRYFEAVGKNRTEKVTEMLRTMGASILIGGISTFLGIIPLALSTSTIFFTIFIAFLGLVVLGLLHGLVLLPVILSLVGTNDNIPHAESSLGSFSTT